MRSFLREMTKEEKADEGHSSDTGRVTSGKQLPYAAPLFVRDNVFDGREENFSAWKVRLTRRLGRMGLLYTLMRTPPEEEYAIPGEAAKEDDRKAWMKKRDEDDVEALDEIVLSVSNEVLNKIIGVEYAKDAMDTLVRAYQRQGTNAMINMRGRLYGLQYKRFETVGELFDSFDAIVRDLDRMDAGLSQEEKIHALLLAIPGPLNHVRAALTVLRKEELAQKSIPEIKRMLFDAELGLRGSVEVGECSGSPNVAMKAGRKIETRCYGCGETGHFRSKCPKIPKSQKKKKKKHPRGGHAMMAMLRISGHLQRNRPEEERVAAAADQLARQEQPAPCRLVVPPRGERRRDPGRRVRFAVDSGASAHMVNSESELEDVEMLEEPLEISTAKSGGTLRAYKKGTVRLQSVVGTTIKNIHLYDVYFIPDLETNLLSVRKATSRGKRVTFQGGVISIETSSEVIAQGRLEDGLYWLDLYRKTDESAMISKQQLSLEHWHKRLGHLSYSGIKQLVQNKMVEGIDCAAKDFASTDKICESCLAGKQTSSKFKTLGLPRTSRPLEVIHSDVCGFMEQSTYDGHRYFVTFIDDFSHFAKIYLLKRKSEVFAKFKEFEAMATAHFGRKISKLRCDNGREYVGKNLQNFCKEKGIQLVLTVPYTPQQNGVSERLNRTLMEKVRSMLFESKLPKSMWGEAKEKLFIAQHIC